MSYQDEVRAIIREFEDFSRRAETETDRESLRRRAEVLDFLVNHEIPRLEREVDELSKLTSAQRIEP